MRNQLAKILLLALAGLASGACAATPIRFYAQLSEETFAFESELPIARVDDDSGEPLHSFYLDNRTVAPSQRGRNRVYEGHYYPWSSYLVIVDIPVDYAGSLRFTDTAGNHIVTIERPAPALAASP
jgi:hypothetical protein